ncbi:MAG: hypothetical protein KA974_08290 [Saprospiraceae bacterium]|nr:hypothetical protein [Saprospiraceae bacterium]MBP7699359.1 hypothetical protein [Saprospiraceae bacterium]
MPTYLKKILLWSAAIVASIWLLLVLLGNIFEDKITALLLKEIRKNITTSLQVKQVDFSLISDFPKASVNLKDIILKDALGGTLLTVETLSFRFGLFSVLGDDIKIDGIAIKNGTIAIITASNGKTNYDIFVTSKSKSNNISFSINEFELLNTEVIYMDEQSEQAANFLLKGVTLSGNVAKQKFELNSEGDLLVQDITNKGKTILQNIPAGLDVVLQVDLQKNQYHIDDSEIQLADLVFAINGTLLNQPAKKNIDLKIKSKAAALRDLLTLVPTVRSTLNDNKVKYEGNVVIDARINGNFGKQNTPLVTAKINLNDGYVGVKEQALESIDLIAKYQNTNGGILEIQQAKGYYNGATTTQFQATVKNFANPYIDLMLNGTMPANILASVLAQPVIKEITGNIDFQKVKIKGNVEQLKNADRLQSIAATGMIIPKNVALIFDKDNLLLKTGQLSLNDNNMNINNLAMSGAGCEAVINGTLYNVLALLAENKTAPELKLAAQLDAKQLDMDRLWAIVLQLSQPNTKANPAAKTVANKGTKTPISPILGGSFKANIDKLNWNKIDAKDFSGNILFDADAMFIDGDVETMGGEMSIEGTAWITDKPHLKANITCDNINIKEFFRQCDNFGQKVLMDKNIRGDLKADIAFDAYWDKAGNLRQDMLHALAVVEVNNGELVNVKMLESFSNYIKIQDLRHVKFNTLQNVFEISNRRIYIPTMTIYCNALNLTLNGEHTFDNDINYNVQVDAAQVLMNRFKRYNASLDPQPAKQSGWFNLYYNIRCAGTDCKYKMTRRQVLDAFALGKIHKDRIQKALDSEFMSSEKQNYIPDIVVQEEPLIEEYFDDLPAKETKSKNDDLKTIFQKRERNKPAKKDEKVPEYEATPDEEYIEFEN